MDPLIIAEKLESLRRCVRRVEARRPATAVALANDVDAQDILALNLTRAVQLCVDMAAAVIADTNELAPQTMGESFDVLARLGVLDDGLARRMRAAVGFRNIAVHNYAAVDWNIVFAIAGDGLADFRDLARAISDRLSQGK